MFLQSEILSFLMKQKSLCGGGSTLVSTLHSLVSGRILKTIFKVPPSPVLLAAETVSMLTEYSTPHLTHIYRIMTQDGPLGVLLPLQYFKNFIMMTVWSGLTKMTEKHD